MNARYQLLSNASGETIEGDTLSEIVDKMIPVHGQFDGDDAASQLSRLEVRTAVLTHYLNVAQSVVLGSLEPEVAEALDEDELTVLLHDRDNQVVTEEWTRDIPLFLSAFQYEPYTDVPRPAGDAVVLVDPMDEQSFIDSLQMLGIAQLFVDESRIEESAG